MASETLEKENGADEIGRGRRLKEHTHASHERLDQAIMRRKPFANRERFGLFVTTQHVFHRDIDALYRDELLADLVPDLADRRRLDLIEQDLADLGTAAPALDAPAAFQADAPIDLPTALGWLYVAEGSNLGAAFLLKNAAKLGLSESFGARHLAGAPKERGLHWRTFTAALDAVPLTEAEENRVVAGAEAAFRRVHALVKEMFS